MSRDLGDAQRERDAELLSAYVDGVAQLSPDERRRVEALLERDPAARADQATVRALLDRVRALPPEGGEPDWAAMERSIGQAVGPSVPRAWWRSRRWLVPLSTFATAVAVLLVLWARPATRSAPVVAVDRGDHEPPPPDTVPLWLDGAEIDVDLSAAELLGDPGIGEDDDLAEAEAETETDVGLLPSSSLAWVDRLDDDAIERAERWLAGTSETSAPPGAPTPSPPGPPGPPRTKG